MTAPRADLDELGRLLAAAHDEVVRLCTPGETWRMSIPANPARDSDLLLSDALTRSTALLAEVADLRETVARVKALVRQAEYRTASSLSRDHDGNLPVGFVPAPDLRAALDSPTSHERVNNGPDSLETCKGCDWESWDTAPTFEQHIALDSPSTHAQQEAEVGARVTIPAHHLVGMDLSFTCTNCGGHTSTTAPCIPARDVEWARADALAADTTGEPS